MTGDIIMLYIYSRMVIVDCHERKVEKTLNTRGKAEKIYVVIE